ncbi:MAG: tRNA (adenosine(37)-N6)-dimethylallyltransferase MiaA [Puniceicoccaceae bacterium]
MSAHPVRILSGPTASGKTRLALDWARRTGGWILSCDALLFYRGADIGTAKPPPAELREIPHYGIDLREPDRPYNLPEYISYARGVLEEAGRRGVPVLVVGGSGFYLSAFHEPAPDPLPVPEAIRDRVRDLENTRGADGLREALLAIDPDPVVDLRNPRRTAPALERCLAAGMTTRQLRERHRALPCPFEEWKREWFVAGARGDTHPGRIAERTEGMLRAGLIEEVKRLRAAGFERNPALRSAIGYRETLECLDGELPERELAEAINRHTRRLAARQRRWIRNRLPESRPVETADDL